MSISDESRIFSLAALIEHSEQQRRPKQPAASEATEDVIDLFAPAQTTAHAEVPPLIIAPLGGGCSPATFQPAGSSQSSLAPVVPSHRPAPRAWPMAALLGACGLAVALACWLFLDSASREASVVMPGLETPIVSSNPEASPMEGPPTAPPVDPGPTKQPSPANKTTAVAPGAEDVAPPKATTPKAATPKAATPKRSKPSPRPRSEARGKPAAPPKARSVSQPAPKHSPEHKNPCAHCQPGDLGCHIKCRANQ